MLKIAWASNYAHPLPEGHRFPMIKYELLPEQLLYEGTVSSGNFFVPQKVSHSKVLRAHDEDYLHKLLQLKLSRQEERRTGFPLSAELVERELTIMQGTLKATDYALTYGAAMNIAGGTHHAYRDRGEGFCLLNDIAIAAYHLLDESKSKKILVVDLDVHQGNGTASIFENEPRVFTFSMHGEKNYPLRKEKSDLDIALPDKTDDKTYISILDRTLKELIQRVEPDFVFYQSGVDVLVNDKLGRLGLSLQGCKERDRIVLKTCKTNNLPVVASMGGGYADNISDIVEAHANTYRLAQEIYF
jgi:acetoin utilization deacetylase AcuC-like enzyme